MALLCGKKTNSEGEAPAESIARFVDQQELRPPQRLADELR